MTARGGWMPEGMLEAGHRERFTRPPFCTVDKVQPQSFYTWLSKSCFAAHFCHSVGGWLSIPFQHLRIPTGSYLTRQWWALWTRGKDILKKDCLCLQWGAGYVNWGEKYMWPLQPNDLNSTTPKTIPYTHAPFSSWKRSWTKRFLSLQFCLLPLPSHECCLDWIVFLKLSIQALNVSLPVLQMYLPPASAINSQRHADNRASSPFPLHLLSTNEVK
jgi:hypothetical protein